MADKRKTLSILGVVGATVIAAGGSAFLTNTALSLMDNSIATVRETEGLSEKETELPITVETFAKTNDSFTIKKKTAATGNKTTAQTERSENGENTQDVGSSENGGVAVGEGTTSYDGNGQAGTAGTSAEGGSTGGSAATRNTYIEPEGYHVDAEGTTYYADGNGNLYYPNGNGGYYWAAGPGAKPENAVIPENTSSNRGSSGGNGSGSNSSAWDDSYMMYDIDSRYISASELSGWGSEDLAKLRNEIFARHGRIFTKQKWIDYFAQKTWYVPTYDASYFDSNMSSFLSDVEWANLNVILKVEDQRG
ncbi:MAG: YARHG domain-containing protein [Eubacteriales bacterium]|nr:YARHG domain-containing protein [Eubacteriales bacterium]